MYKLLNIMLEFDIKMFKLFEIRGKKTSIITMREKNHK